jgi:hypothetical protein
MILKDAGRTGPRSPGRGLSGLEGMPLGYALDRMLDAADASSGGPPEWRNRKRAEAHDLLALTRLAPERIRVEQLDLSSHLRAVIHLRAPVPTWPSGSDDLVLAPGALLGLSYRPECLVTAQPGASFVQILEPREVFLPQVPVDPPYCLCLAPTLPAGIPCREIVLMAFDALVAGNHQFDTRHPGGVFREDAANWYQKNGHRLPFTREPFLVHEKRADS